MCLLLFVRTLFTREQCTQQIMIGSVLNCVLYCSCFYMNKSRRYTILFVVSLPTVECRIKLDSSTFDFQLPLHVIYVQEHTIWFFDLLWDVISAHHTSLTADAISGKLPWKRAVYCVQIRRTNNLHEESDLCCYHRPLCNVGKIQCWHGFFFFFSFCFFLYSFLLLCFIMCNFSVCFAPYYSLQHRPRNKQWDSHKKKFNII